MSRRLVHREPRDGADVPWAVLRDGLLYGLQAITAKPLRNTSPNQRMGKLYGSRVMINVPATLGTEWRDQLYRIREWERHETAMALLPRDNSVDALAYFDLVSH